MSYSKGNYMMVNLFTALIGFTQARHHPPHWCPNEQVQRTGKTVKRYWGGAHYLWMGVINVRKWGTAGYSEGPLLPLTHIHTQAFTQVLRREGASQQTLTILPLLGLIRPASTSVWDWVGVGVCNVLCVFTEGLHHWVWRGQAEKKLEGWKQLLNNIQLHPVPLHRIHKSTTYWLVIFNKPSNNRFLIQLIFC